MRPRLMVQEPERSHGAETDGKDHYRERDSGAKENALGTVQLPFRSRHNEIVQLRLI